MKLKNQKFILTAIFVALIALFIIVIMPLFYVKNTINKFYKNASDDNFVSNKEIVKKPDFTNNLEMLRLHTGLFNQRHAVFYKAEAYKDGRPAVITDFFYIKRTKLIFWEVEKYETAYVPVLDEENYNLDNAYNDLKSDVEKGTISKGLTPDQERDLATQNTQAQKPHIENETLNSLTSPDNTSSLLIKSGKNEGENYLSINDKNLGINNVVNATWCSDNKFIAYTTGEYYDALKTLLPKSDLWITDLDGNKKLFVEIKDQPNALSIFCHENVIIYSTKNSIWKINKDGTENAKLIDYDMINTRSEEFLLAEILTFDGEYVYISIPDKDYLENNILNEWKIKLDGSGKEKIS